MYLSYTYAYPHKTAYRPFDSPPPLRDVWADVRKTGLFVYMHIPFVEKHCGFCNLFTALHPGASLDAQYVSPL